MRPETRQFLLDALSAAEEVLSIGDQWLEDRYKGLAVERLLVTVGEALSRISSTDPAVFDKIPDARLIVGLRNVIVHGYDKLDSKRIAAAIQDDLPIFTGHLRDLLD